MTEADCTCGHPKADHYAGECRRFLNRASVICACRVFRSRATKEPVTHGTLPAPDLEQLLDPDPERFLAGGPLHDPCAGGEECDAMCVCEAGE